MAYISLDIVEQLWNEMDELSWYELRKTLDVYRNIPGSVPDGTIDMLYDLASDMDDVNHEFPRDSYELYDLINSEIGNARYAHPM